MPRYVRQDGQAVPISDLPSPPHASGVSFTDSGLAVITGVSDVQAALEAADAALDNRPTHQEMEDSVAESVLTARANQNNQTVASTERTWGDESTLFTGLEGETVEVLGWGNGYASNTNSTSQRVAVELQLSLDGGSTWPGGREVHMQVGTDEAQRMPVTAHYRRSGEVTGNVMARLRVWRVSGGGSDDDTTMANGDITAMLTVSAA